MCNISRGDLHINSSQWNQQEKHEIYLLHLLLSIAPTFFFPLIFIYGKNFIEERF